MSDSASPASLPNAPPLDPAEDLVVGESQWSIIVREFRKRKLAVVSLWCILLVALLAVFAPLIANDRPLAYRGTNRFEYSEALRAIRVMLQQEAEPVADSANAEQTVASSADRRAVIVNRFAFMRSVAAADSSDRLAQIESEALTLLDGPASVERSEALLRLRSRAGEELTPDKVVLRSGWRFPAIAGLEPHTIAMMLFLLLVMSAGLWRGWLQRRFGRGHPLVNRVWLSMLIGLPLFAAFAWWLVVPGHLDRTRYKEGSLASAVNAETGNVPVIYESVYWPLVPFALDEPNLLNTFAAPVGFTRDNVADATGPGQGSAAEAADATTSPPAIVAKPENGLPRRAKHWLGTDDIGRDLLTRMIWGGRVSLAVGIVAVSIYVVIGIIIGAVAGYFRGWTDMLISRVIEIVICFPSFFLILTIVAFVGPGMFNIMVVIGLTSWTGVARLVRAEFLRLSEQEFVQAGRALGYSPPRLIFRHVLPNAMAPVLVSATFGVASAILTESALSFLGIGITVPTPSWGGILADGRQVMNVAPWMIVIPGMAIFLTITWYNLVGEAFRDAADPRLRGAR
ncbi:MAG: ABC transporter permease [Planctomycetaceae bacterium]